MATNDKDKLSFDVLNLLKVHCFGNISRLYRKYNTCMNMSSMTFYRAMRGEPVRDIYIREIERLADRIGLTSTPKEDSRINLQYIQSLLDIHNKIADAYKDVSDSEGELEAKRQITSLFLYYNSRRAEIERAMQRIFLLVEKM